MLVTLRVSNKTVSRIRRGPVLLNKQRVLCSALHAQLCREVTPDRCGKAAILTELPERMLWK